jgi:hypothetical protein
MLRPALQAEEPAAREPGEGTVVTGIAEWMPDVPRCACLALANVDSVKMQLSTKETPVK